MTKQIGQVIEKDYTRLGRGNRESGSDGIHVKKSDQKTIHVSVLEKRENNQNKVTREVGLRVWSKKARNKRSDNKEGMKLQMVNRGKIQRDRNVAMESLDREQLNGNKTSKEVVTGVYTRIGVRGENSTKVATGRENVYNLIQKNMVDQDRKRIGMGRKEHHMGKRMWFNTKKRNDKQIRNILNLLAASMKKEAGELNTNGLSKKLKDVYTLTVMKGLMKQVFARARITVNRNKGKEEVQNS